jgi:hypothetical protein
VDRYSDLLGPHLKPTVPQRVFMADGKSSVELRNMLSVNMVFICRVTKMRYEGCVSFYVMDLGAKDMIIGLQHIVPFFLSLVHSSLKRALDDQVSAPSSSS